MDGGASRRRRDSDSVSDLVILPFTADDDFQLRRHPGDAEFPEALALPTNWTTNSKAADVDAGYIEKLEALYPGRILPPTPTTHSVRDFILQRFTGALLPPAQRYCRTLARRVIDILEVERRRREGQGIKKNRIRADAWITLDRPPFLFTISGITLRLPDHHSTRFPPQNP